MKSFTYVIQDPVGIHARPAGLLAKTAKSFADTAITLTKGEKTVKATQLMKLMGLGVQTGDSVTVTAEGSLGHLLQLGHGLFLGLLQTGKLRLLVLGGPADGAQLDPLIKIKGAVLNAFGDALSL